MTKTVASSTKTARKLRHFSHITARQKALAALAAETPELLDIGAETIPGEAPTPLSDGEFEELMAAHAAGDIELPDLSLDVLDLPAPQAFVADEEVSAEPAPDTRTYAERLADVGDDEAMALTHQIAARIDDRLSRANEKSEKNLNRARRAMIRGHVSRCLLATGNSDGAAFINREWMEGKEFNVYGLLKLPDIAAGLNGGIITNEINIAVIKSMFALEKAGIPFDFDTAKAAASTSHAPQRPGVRQYLTRHTVSANTASTQAGSTMHALMALGVVTFKAAKNPTYTILQNATTEALRNARFEAAEEE